MLALRWVLEEPLVDLGLGARVVQRGLGFDHRLVVEVRSTLLFVRLELGLTDLLIYREDQAKLLLSLLPQKDMWIVSWLVSYM